MKNINLNELTNEELSVLMSRLEGEMQERKKKARNAYATEISSKLYEVTRKGYRITIRTNYDDDDTDSNEINIDMGANITVEVV